MWITWSASPPLAPHVICRHADEEIIILKDAEKNLLEYEDSDETNRMRRELQEYNELLERKFIDIDLIGYVVSGDKPLKIDTTNKRVRRIFNNGSFDQSISPSSAFAKRRRILFVLTIL
jgi:hypothetical protein